MRHQFVFAIAALVMAVVPGETLAQAPTLSSEQNQRLCSSPNRRANPELTMRACTTLVDSTTESAAIRSVALAHRAALFASFNQIDDATRDFEAAVQLDPRNAAAFGSRGQMRLQQRDFAAAIPDFDRAIAIDPSLAPAFHYRGNARFMMGDRVAAIADYDQAIRLQPNDIGSLTNRATALEDLGEFERALRDLDQLVQYSPNDADVFYARGRLAFYLGRFAAASADLGRLPEFGALNPYHALWMHIAFARDGRAADSRLAERLAGFDLKAWPGAVLAHLAGQATLEQVLAAARDGDAERERGQNCEAYFYAGEMALARGDTAEARRLFGLAIATNVTDFIEYRGARIELDRLQGR